MSHADLATCALLVLHSQDVILLLILLLSTIHHIHVFCSGESYKMSSTEFQFLLSILDFHVSRKRKLRIVNLIVSYLKNCHTMTMLLI